MFSAIAILISLNTSLPAPQATQQPAKLDSAGFTCGPMRPNAVGGSVRTCEPSRGR